MRTRETYLQDVVTQLLKLNFEITVLKFRVEQAMPEAMRACYCHVKSLLDRYQAMETQIQALEEEQNEDWVSLRPGIDHGLKELSEACESVDTLVRMRLSEEVCFAGDLPERYRESFGRKEPGRAPRVRLNAKRRRKKRMLRFAGIIDA